MGTALACVVGSGSCPPWIASVLKCSGVASFSCDISVLLHKSRPALAADIGFGGFSDLAQQKNKPLCQDQHRGSMVIYQEFPFRFFSSFLRGASHLKSP